MTVKSDRKYKSEADGREKSTLRPWQTLDVSAKIKNGL
jgi:hypothetical protein